MYMYMEYTDIKISYHRDTNTHYNALIYYVVEKNTRTYKIPVTPTYAMF